MSTIENIERKQVERIEAFGKLGAKADRGQWQGCISFSATQAEIVLQAIRNRDRMIEALAKQVDALQDVIKLNRW